MKLSPYLIKTGLCPLSRANSIWVFGSYWHFWGKKVQVAAYLLQISKTSRHHWTQCPVRVWNIRRHKFVILFSCHDQLFTGYWITQQNYSSFLILSVHIPLMIFMNYKLSVHKSVCSEQMQKWHRLKINSFCYLHHYRNVVISKVFWTLKKIKHFAHEGIYTCRDSHDAITNLLNKNIFKDSNLLLTNFLKWHPSFYFLQVLCCFLSSRELLDLVNNFSFSIC